MKNKTPAEKLRARINKFTLSETPKTNEPKISRERFFEIMEEARKTFKDEYSNIASV